MKTAKELFLESIEKDEIYKFLIGEGDYKVPVPHMVPVYIPTDWTDIIPSGIYELYKDRPDLNVDILFENALADTIKKGNIGLYAVVNLVLDQFSREKNNSAAFKIDKSKLVPLINSELIKKSGDLKNDFSWMGKGQPEGLWSEIARIDKIMKRDLGIGLL
jgi:hypothetical protein